MRALGHDTVRVFVGGSWSGCGGAAGTEGISRAYTRDVADSCAARRLGEPRTLPWISRRRHRLRARARPRTPSTGARHGLALGQRSSSVDRGRSATVGDDRGGCASSSPSSRPRAPRRTGSGREGRETATPYVLRETLAGTTKDGQALESRRGAVGRGSVRPRRDDTEPLVGRVEGDRGAGRRLSPASAPRGRRTNEGRPWGAPLRFRARAGATRRGRRARSRRARAAPSVLHRPASGRA